MALLIELKADEQILIGSALVRNAGGSRTKLAIKTSTEVPILRSKQILTEATANTPAKRVYFAVQLMLLAADLAPYQDRFLELCRDLVAAAPSTTPYLEAIARHLLAGAYYKALKEASALVAYEAELLGHAMGEASDRSHKP